MHRMGSAVSVDARSDTDSDDANGILPPPQPTLSSGRTPLGFGRSALTSLAVCALFIMCATAVPLTAATFGGVASAWVPQRLHRSVVLLQYVQ
ncbi:hypothetical protein CYMTET_42700, partial [Cymbomonas tetramitiformis]